MRFQLFILLFNEHLYSIFLKQRKELRSSSVSHYTFWLFFSFYYFRWSFFLIIRIQFSVLLEPLMNSFNTSVSTASIEDMYRTTILWVEQHCSLVDLRPGIFFFSKHSEKKLLKFINDFFQLF